MSKGRKLIGRGLALVIISLCSTFNSHAQSIDNASVQNAGLAYNQCIHKKAQKFATELVKTNNFKNYKGIYYEFKLPIQNVKANLLRYATRHWYAKLKKAKSLSDIGTNFDRNGTFSFDESYEVPNTYQYGERVSSSASSRIYFDLNICDSLVNIQVYCPIYTIHYLSKIQTDIIKGKENEHFEFYPLSVFPFKNTNKDELYAIIYANTSARCIQLAQDWTKYVIMNYGVEESEDSKMDSETSMVSSSSNTDSNTLDLSISADGSFSKVIETELSAQDEYKYIRSYLSKKIKDYKSKSQIEDDNTGELVCEFSLPLHASKIYKDEPYELDGSFIMRLNVECKDKKFRIKGEDVKSVYKFHRVGGYFPKDTMTEDYESITNVDDSVGQKYKSMAARFIIDMIEYLSKQKEDDF